MVLRSVLVSPERRRTILGLALPIIGGMASQNVLNLIDTAMVGSLGDEALAAVGLGGFLNFLMSAFVMGIGTGVQAITARRVGEGHTEGLARALNGGLILATMIGAVFSLVLILNAEAIFAFVADDPALPPLGTPYLQWRLAGIAFLGMNYGFRGYWNATNRTRLYLSTIVVMHVVNAVISYVLIFGVFGAPKMGVEGAGIGSFASAVVGTLFYSFLAVRHTRGEGFLTAKPGADLLKQIMKLGTPTGIQQTFFAAGMTVFFVIVGKVGTDALAATQVIVNLLLVGILPGIGFGLACGSLVGQALGRKEPDDAYQWGWDVVRLAIITIMVVTLPIVLFPRPILGLFIHNLETLELAVLPVRLVCGTLFIDTAGLVLMQAMMGAGYVKRVAMVSVGMQWLLFLPAAYLVGPVLGYGLLAVWACNVTYRCIQAVILANMWRSRGWQRVDV